MKHLLLSGCLLAFSPLAAAQSATDANAVKKTIDTFFEGMRKGDSAMVRSTLAPGVVLQTISTRGGSPQVRTDNPADLLKAVGTPHPEVWDERISYERVLIDADLASVWTPYQFFAGNKFSHCGYNSFQLVRMAQGWKIVHVIDTRRKDKCKQ
ncbi:nuclear transport factor 2 family protein [Hymenobacter oligotrophus]|nr:nuclear transport factor 2 family protein [Hymenobacter oligotrophus]